MEDKRFTHVANDPKFRRIPKGERKVKIDKRFKSMFKDKKFKVEYTVDSRGRPVNRTSTEDLKRYYHLSSEESSSEEDESDQQNDAGKFVKASNESSSEEDENDQGNNKQNDAGKFVKAPKESDNDSETELNKLIVNESDIKTIDCVKDKLKNLQVDYARGEGKLFSDSSSDDESDSEDLQAGEIEHNWGELDADAERTDEITNRLAACNMDWDRIKAVDLMVLFNSFVSQGSVIKSVAIYPSEFGKQRLKEEEVNGPTELVEKKSENLDEDEEKEEGSKYHMEKLRQYQLNRLKYYYAVITCDSPNTANKIYTECDGMEYESSAIKIDLRFVPDDMVFDDLPKEVCDKLPEATKYQPRFFTTSALQQAKVNLTWDETNPDRIELTQKIASGKIDEIDENDLQAYLAYSSNEEEDEGNEEAEEDESESENEQVNPIDKYRALLSEIETKEKEKEQKDVEMEISWGIDLEKRTDKLIKEKLSENENKTPFQNYLEKRKEKRKERREERKKKIQDGENNSSSEDDDVPSDVDLNDPYFAEEFENAQFKQKKKLKHKASDENSEINKQKEAELELLLMNDDDRKHFNMKKIQEQESETKSKKKRKKKQIEEKVDEFELNVNDERFSALFTSHHYNIDPTDSHYKKTKGMERLISEKLKRRNDEAQQVEISKKPKNEAERNILVKSVKRKAQAFVNKKS